MSTGDLLQSCYEDRIRLAFTVLCESLTQGEDDGALRFEKAVRIALKAKVQAMVVLAAPQPTKLGWALGDGEADQ